MPNLLFFLIIKLKRSVIDIGRRIKPCYPSSISVCNHDLKKNTYPNISNDIDWSTQCPVGSYQTYHMVIDGKFSPLFKNRI